MTKKKSVIEYVIVYAIAGWIIAMNLLHFGLTVCLIFYGAPVAIMLIGYLIELVQKWRYRRWEAANTPWRAYGNDH